MISRVDNNQSEIVAILRNVGASVQHLHELGRGCPDILVGFRGKNYLFEIKSKRGELTPAELEFARLWGGQYEVVRSAEEALKAIGAN